MFFGLSVRGALTPEMVRSMAGKPIIFAMANPDPEITPEEARAVSPDAIIATGRSDYPNQVNNVLGFPYIFRGALDVRASTINDAMKVAAAEALAALAREDVPDEVHAASAGGRRLTFGPEYIIPNAFDPRLISRIPPAWPAPRWRAASRASRWWTCGSTAASCPGAWTPRPTPWTPSWSVVRANPRRVVFAEGEEEKVVRAAVAFRNAGYGTPVLVGREDRVRTTLAGLGLGALDGIEIHNARLSHKNAEYTRFLYARQQREGMLERDCQRMVNQDRNIFAACMVAAGDADAMLTGLTRSAAVCLADIGHVIETAPNRISFGLTLMLGAHGAIMIADTLIHERPTPQQLADIAVGAAAAARHLGHEPRVALLSHSTFGNPMHSTVQGIRDAVAIPGPARRGLRVRRRHESGRGLGPGHPRPLPVLPPDGERQPAGDAGPALRPHHLPPRAPAGRHEHHRPGAAGAEPPGADHPHGRVRQRDRGPGGDRGLPVHHRIGPATRSDAVGPSGHAAGSR